MRRIAIAVMSTISGLVLLFSYHTSTGQGGAATLGAAGGSGSGLGGHGSGNGSGHGGPGGGNGSAASGSSGSGSSGSGSSGTGSSGSGSGSSGSGSASGSSTVTGDLADTRWGPVQVQITVKNGKIVSSDAVVFPNENFRDQEINSYAIPQLNQQAVQAQSAQIDGVSGATVTSGGYQQSLQSAIDKAHLG